MLMGAFFGFCGSRRFGSWSLGPRCPQWPPAPRSLSCTRSSASTCAPTRSSSGRHQLPRARNHRVPVRRASTATRARRRTWRASATSRSASSAHPGRVDRAGRVRRHLPRRVFGDLNFMIWLSFVVLILSYVVLFKTSIGLRIRAVGEHPRAADTVGISVYGIRYARRHHLGRAGGARGRVPLARRRQPLRPEHDRRTWLHRSRRAHLRQLATVRRVAACLLFGFSSALGDHLAGVLRPRAPRHRSSSTALPYVLTLDRRRWRHRTLDSAGRRWSAVRQAVAWLGRLSRRARLRRRGRRVCRDAARRRLPDALQHELRAPARGLCDPPGGGTRRSRARARPPRPQALRGELVPASGSRVATAGHVLGIVGLCLAASALVALGVYGLLEYVGSRG